MYKKIVVVLFILLLTNVVKAQAPNWVVNQNEYQYTMTFVGFLTIDGVMLASTNDKIGAFVNGTCRGVGNLIYESSQNRYYVYLTVFSNIENESISFKIFDSGKNAVRDVPKSKPFVINQHNGNLFQAYSFATPTLSSAAELLDINFKYVVRQSISISGTNVLVSLDKQQDLTALNTLYTASPGTSVYIASNKIASGSNALNFTSTIIFKVRSEDELVVKDWSVTMITPISFFKKNVVCYANGEIKVNYPNEGEIVALELGGQVIATQKIISGTTTFGNLSVGVYKVKVAGYSKEISIIKQPNS